MRIVTGLSWLIATPSDWFPWYQMVSGPKDQMQLRCRRCHHRFFFSTVSHCPITVEYLWESHDCPLKPLFFQCCTTTATHFLRHPSDKALRFFIPRKLVTAHAMRQRECKKSKKRRRLPASAQRGFVWGPQNLQFTYNFFWCFPKLFYKSSQYDPIIFNW